MQNLNKLRSRLGSIIFLASLLVLGVVAGLRQRRQPDATQQAAPAISAERPRNHVLMESELLSFAKAAADHEKSLSIASVERANGERPSFEGEPFFMRSPRTGVELAEAHNLIQMRSYQQRVTRQLKSRNPILPVSLVPTIEETIFEDSSAK